MRDLLIADKQYITQAGLRFVASALSGIENIISVGCKKDLIKSLIEKPDLIIVVDYLLFDFAGVEEMMIISQRFPESNWILFSDSLTDGFLRQVVYDSDSFSVVLKTASLQEINSALASSLRNERFICSRVNNQLQNSKSEGLESTLTTTEREVLKAMALGKTTKEIAFERNSSFHTVITHRKNIFRKLDVNNVYEATKYAMRAGLVDMGEYSI